MRFGIGGAVPLTVRGRRSGQPRRIPVLPVEYTGASYLVSPRGETEWVRNLRAAGEGTLERDGRSEPFRAVEVPVGERPPILDVYRTIGGRTVKGYFDQLPDAADHPVFRMDRTTG
jgi:deazaflavin-dependent oxidoreductase (nitroreductase family)